MNLQAEEAATAEVYAQYIESFQESAAVGKTFVKADVINADNNSLFISCFPYFAYAFFDVVHVFELLNGNFFYYVFHFEGHRRFSSKVLLFCIWILVNYHS